MKSELDLSGFLGGLHCKTSVILRIKSKSYHFCFHNIQNKKISNDKKVLEEEKWWQQCREPLSRRMKNMRIKDNDINCSERDTKRTRTKSVDAFVDQTRELVWLLMMNLKSFAWVEKLTRLVKSEKKIFRSEESEKKF